MASAGQVAERHAHGGAILDTYAPQPFLADPSLGIQWAHVRGLTECFSSHSHDFLLLGLTREGEEDFIQEGRPGRSTPGMVRLMAAGVEHAGGALPGGIWSYDALYCPPALADELLGHEEGRSLPAFRAPVVSDPQLAGCLVGLFRAFQMGEPLAVTEQLASALQRAVSSHSLTALSSQALVRHRGVERVRDLMHAHHADKLKLDWLAREAGLSKFHLIRCFRAQTGLTPWQYQTQLRIHAAKRALLSGAPPGAVAIDSGFVDQSHFTRTFRSVVGMTPAAFACAVRRPAGTGRAPPISQPG